MSVPRPTPVVLDTDLGSDVDDLLALLMVLASPELELVGITASYGDTLLRARLAAQACRWAGVEVPIGAGPTATLSGRPIWEAGHEASQLRDRTAAAFEPADATEVLVAAADAHPGELHVIAIAPLTTVATALRSHPALAERLGGLVVMGGRFDDPRPEHNLACDAVAADEVLGAGLDTRIIGVDVTARTRLPAARFPELAPHQTTLDHHLLEVLEQWTRFTSEPFSIPHDPLAVAMLTRPDAFSFAHGAVAVATGGEEAGSSRFTAGPGTIRRVVDHASDLADHMIERIGCPRLRGRSAP